MHIKENIFWPTHIFSHHREIIVSGTEIKPLILSSSTFFWSLIGSNCPCNRRLFFSSSKGWIRPLQIRGIKVTRSTPYLTEAQFLCFSVGKRLLAWGKKEVSEWESFPVLFTPSSPCPTIFYSWLSCARPQIMLMRRDGETLHMVPVSDLCYCTCSANNIISPNWESDSSKMISQQNTKKAKE